MNLKVLAIMCVCAALVSGCSTRVQAVDAKSAIYQSNSGLYVWCDYQKGVEYIGVSHGMSVRYNDDGTVSKCAKQ